jgi:hypothetical protein
MGLRKQKHETPKVDAMIPDLRIVEAARKVVQLVPHEFSEVGAPYETFVPEIELDGKHLSRTETITEVRKLIHVMKKLEPSSIDFGQFKITLNGVQDLHEKVTTYLGQDIYKSCPAVVAVIDAIVHRGMQGGTYDDCMIYVSYGQPSEATSRTGQHLDGYAGNPETNLDHKTSVGGVRYVYSTGPGTMVFPKANPQHIHVIETKPNQIINPLGANLDNDERLDSEVLQVLPGAAVGFDLTNNVWHQAPERTSDELTINVTLVRQYNGASDETKSLKS